MDAIQVRSIRAYGYTGLLLEEQTLGQWFEVDLTLWVNLAPAAQSDQIDDSGRLSFGDRHRQASNHHPKNLR